MKSIIALATVVAGTASGQSYGGPPNAPRMRVPGPPYVDPHHEAPLHYADDHRQCKAGGAPCCTANFETKKAYGKSYTVKPALNQRLFMDECPAKKTDEAICEAAAKKFTKYGTTLSQKKDYKPKGFVYKMKKPRKQPVYAYGAEAEGVEAEGVEAEGVSAAAVAAAAAKGYKKEIFGVDDPLIVKGEWWSDTKADIAVITTGCCSNVFADVNAGDKLDTMCENDMIGDPNDLYNLGRYSIVTPGRFRYGCEVVGDNRRRRLTGSRDETCDVPFSSIFAGTFEKGIGDDDFASAQIETTPVQYWANIAVAALCTILDDWMVIEFPSRPGTIAQRSPLSEDWTGFFAPLAEEISLEEREVSIAVMEARVCAYSDLLSSLERTDGATVGGRPGEVDIDCSKADNPGSTTCVVDLDAEVLTKPITMYKITLGEFDQLVVNVWSKEISITGTTSWTTDPAGRERSRAVIWNFQETESFHFNINAYGVEVDFVLPRATNVSIKALQLYSATSVLLGKRESLLDLEGPWDDAVGKFMMYTLPLPPVETKVTLCTCLCPEEDCYHR